MTYNDTQRQAITHGSGPCIVLAGPGSGKTSVICERMQYLIDEVGVDPMRILVITFTRAAAEEMKTRFFAGMQGRTLPCTFGTFHSVFFMFLRAAYHYRGNQVISDDEKYALMRKLVRVRELPCEDEDELISGILAEISLMKSEMIDLRNFYSRHIGDESFRELYRSYQRALSDAGKLDFDDMMVYCLELFTERKDILSNWQRRYSYILIDEFQDINPIQYRIINMLAEPENNLFVVGDDDQSVYRFRGARPEIMLGFQKDYPTARVVTLDTNYRCSRDIAECAARVIGHNRTRYEKRISAKQPYFEPVRVEYVKSKQEEALHIIKKTQEYQRMGIPLHQMAVLYRTANEPRVLVEQLMRYNLPFTMRDYVPSLYQHFAVKDVLAYVRAALGDTGRQTYLQIINKPKRYISREAFSKPQVDMDAVLDFYEDKKWAQEKLLQFSNDLHVLRKMTPYAAVAYIRRGVGYDDYLREYADYRHIREEELFAALDELTDQVKAYRSYDDWFAGIEAYEAARREQARANKTGGEGIVLSTMHNAKGLEFDAVFIIACNEGICPHQKAVQPEDIEEERRMFYVAMTRAKRYLHIYVPREIFGKEAEPSRFIGELAAP